jgi:hypothetical protein
MSVNQKQKNRWMDRDNDFIINNLQTTEKNGFATERLYSFFQSFAACCSFLAETSEEREEPEKEEYYFRLEAMALKMSEFAKTGKI